MTHLLRLLGGLFAIFMIAGCAHRTGTQAVSEPKSSYWSGRLSLRTDAQPPQSWSAGFELEGSAQEGRLGLYSPLGSTLAGLRWQAGQASLRMGEQMLTAESLDALLTRLEPEPGPLQSLPLQALLDWLAGRPTPAPGWTVDLSRLAQGRLHAQRSGMPQVMLQLILDLPELPP